MFFPESFSEAGFSFRFQGPGVEERSRPVPVLNLVLTGVSSRQDAPFVGKHRFSLDETPTWPSDARLVSHKWWCGRGETRLS